MKRYIPFIIIASIGLTGCGGGAAAVVGFAAPVVIEAYRAVKTEVICPSLSDKGKKRADNVAEHVRGDSSYTYCP